MTAASNDDRPVKRLMISPQDAADMLSVDRDTIFRWIKDGRLPATKLSPRVVRIRIADIEAMIDARRL
jgi:excisionase family DNA binding protein